MASAPAAARALAAYKSNAVTTATPMGLVVMLYERLARDLDVAEAALGVRDLETANSQLQHAQEIVLELRVALDPTQWEGAANLGRFYDFLHDQLVAANVAKSGEQVAACRALVQPLLEAWSAAAANITP